MVVAALELTGWRRSIQQLYAMVRAAPRGDAGRAIWQAGRDELFRSHPQSPLSTGDPLRSTGIPLWPYDERYRFSLTIRPAAVERTVVLPTDGGNDTRLRLLGTVDVPEPVGATLGVWSLEQYGGGIFVPLRDGTAGSTTYGGGRYILDTAKGADLGGTGDALVLDFNFAYHPSCRYDPSWQCPLAPAENTIAIPVPVGECLSPP